MLMGPLLLQQAPDGGAVCGLTFMYLMQPMSRQSTLFMSMRFHCGVLATR
jgi:hypothetical protein